MFLCIRLGREGQAIGRRLPKASRSITHFLPRIKHSPGGDSRHWDQRYVSALDGSAHLATRCNRSATGDQCRHSKPSRLRCLHRSLPGKTGALLALGCQSKREESTGRGGRHRVVVEGLGSGVVVDGRFEPELSDGCPRSRSRARRSLAQRWCSESASSRSRRGRMRALSRGGMCRRSR